ncbi:MAG: hypothetical protein Ct9H90mP30_0030 [Actinomycetota bacterium]|nr:MAG: hypothetical protein Ct9H90mP30_0030 [Actinomycetota bacterium]
MIANISDHSSSTRPMGVCQTRSHKQLGDVDPNLTLGQIVVQGHQGLENRIKEFIDVGASKFILVPYIEPEDWLTELESLAEATLELQT